MWNNRIKIISSNWWHFINRLSGLLSISKPLILSTVSPHPVRPLNPSGHSYYSAFPASRATEAFRTFALKSVKFIDAGPTVKTRIWQAFVQFCENNIFFFVISNIPTGMKHNDDTTKTSKQYFQIFCGCFWFDLLTFCRFLCVYVCVCVNFSPFSWYF